MIDRGALFAHERRSQRFKRVLLCAARPDSTCEKTSPASLLSTLPVGAKKLSPKLLGLHTAVRAGGQFVVTQRSAR